MNLMSICKSLLETFPNEIKTARTENQNELYLEIDPRELPKIAKHVNNDVKCTLVSLFASDERGLTGGFAIYYTFAQRETASLIILKIVIEKGKTSFITISDIIPAAMYYEREIKDLFGLYPFRHPDARRLICHGNWPKEEYPLRKDFDRKHKPKFASRKNHFKKIEGEGVYEIPVGPVHAGIIEPGHFRFSVAGEPIISLEAQLGFVHKGLEKLADGMNIEKAYYISERISGDESFTNSFAYCQAIEKIAGIEIPRKAQLIRVFFAELERLTSHMGDLGGLCVDTGYGFAAFQFKMMRIWCYGLADLVCGYRYLRNVNRIGGVRADFLTGKEAEIVERLSKIRRELADTVKIIKSHGMFVDRVEHTGILLNRIAVDLNATGPSGRASGIDYDMRKAFGYSQYCNFDLSVPFFNDGDVNSRMNVKLEESTISIDIMEEVLKKLYIGGFANSKLAIEVGQLPPYKCAFGYTEAPRGENIHFVMTGENNTIFRYKVRTPSFCNWPCVCYAVKGNIVPDFPLINKSFNLSYAGYDL